MAPSGKVNWNDVETWKRVVAALLATGVKPDLKQTATFFGTTYDTLENRFRNIKNDAQALKDEVNSGQRGEVTAPTRSRSAPTTPRKQKTPKKDALSTVTNGRVAKASPRGGKKKTVKQEDIDNSLSTIMDDIHDPALMSFDTDFGGNMDDGDLLRF